MAWLDTLPSHEKKRLKKRLRSPEAYEALREKVKGPEDLAQEMEANSNLAELSFSLETEPKVQEALQKSIQDQFLAGGLEAVASDPTQVSNQLKQSLVTGDFVLKVESNDNGEDQLTLAPEGNISEKMVLSQSVTQNASGSLLGNSN